MPGLRTECVWVPTTALSNLLQELSEAWLLDDWNAGWSFHPQNRFLRLTCTFNHLSQFWGSQTASLRSGQNILCSGECECLKHSRTLLSRGGLCPLYCPGWVGGGWREWNSSLCIHSFLPIVWYRQGSLTWSGGKLCMWLRDAKSLSDPVLYLLKFSPIDILETVCGPASLLPIILSTSLFQTTY